MENTEKLNMQTTDVHPGKGMPSGPLADMNLMDDFMFDVATTDLETSKVIIELSLGIRIRRIAWKEGQKVIHNLPGKRDIRMDFYVEDEDGQVFEVEMQKRNTGNIPKRTRYYQALIDSPMLKSGEKGFDNLRPAYIIVICGFDLFGMGLYRYTFDNRCQERPDLVLGDGCRKIILNTRGRNEDEVEKPLVDFLKCVEQSSEENVPENCDERLKYLHGRVSHIKADEQIGVTYMHMEERDRLIREEGEKAKEISQVRKKMGRGMETEQIAEQLELEKTYVQSLMDMIRSNPELDDYALARELEG